MKNKHGIQYHRMKPKKTVMVRFGDMTEYDIIRSFYGRSGVEYGTVLDRDWETT